MPAGILNLNKPSGLTSHDVVDRVRALTGLRRIGHAGTLDPLATGVLLVCVGPATRVSEYLMAGRKVYRACARLGVTTDTYDADGQVIARSPVEVGCTQVQAMLPPFRGVILQVPPMYSAVKHRGEALYRLARRGIQVERKPRPVKVFRLELTAWRQDEITLEIACSPGTYVRALVHDLGQALGCGACLTALTRLASGSFRIEDSATLKELAEVAADRRWSGILHPIDVALTQFPAVCLNAGVARRICSGQAVSLLTEGITLPGEDQLQRAGGRTEILARAYGPGGAFLALVIYDSKACVLRPRKVFCAPEL